VGIWIIPYAPCSVKVLAPDGEVNNLDDTMRKKEEGNCIGGEIVDIGALEHQIHGAQAELQQQQEEIHLEKIKFIAYGQLSTPQP